MRYHNWTFRPRPKRIHLPAWIHGTPSLVQLTFYLALVHLILSVSGSCAQVDLPTANVSSNLVLDPIAVQIVQSGEVSQIRVLTLGNPDSDFLLTSAGTCSIGTQLPSGTSCAVTASFQPKAAGLRRGAVVLIGRQGELLGSTLFSGVGVGPVSTFSPAIIDTVAGNGQWLFTGDNGAATDSSVFLPGGVAVDAQGNFYIADSGNNRIRLVNRKTGTITTVAGTGSPSSANDGRVATAAGVSDPGALILDGAGDLYIADSSNHAVRKLSLTTGLLTTVAGRLGQQGYAGDGDLATSALLNTPEGLALDSVGNLFIADTKNHVVRRVDGRTGLISTYAGSVIGFDGDGGPAITAKLNGPWGLGCDLNDNLFIADLNNNRIRKVSSGGTITTVVGDGTNNYAVDGQSALATSISNPAAVAVDAAGNLYVADSGHNVVRKVSAVTGLATAVAGTSNPTFTGDAGPATMAGLYGPYALSLDSLGNVYIADIFHHRIREIETSQAKLSFQPIRVGRTSPSQPQTLENDGNAPLTFRDFNPDQNASIDAATTTCKIGVPLPIDSTCVIGAQFFPQVTGSNVTARIQPLSDAVNSPGQLSLTGEVDELEPTRTTLQANTNPAAFGATVTFTASVTGDASQPKGNVRFFDGALLIGSSATDAQGVATFSTGALSVGVHTITANFTGDAQNSPSTSPSLTEVVKRTALVQLSSTAPTIKVGQSLVAYAKVSTDLTQPTGSVLFSDGVTPLATIPLGSDGTAAYNVSSFSAGTHVLSALYSGDANTLSAKSNDLSEESDRWSVTVTVASSKAVSDIGESVTLSIEVLPTSSTTPTGSIVLKDGSASIATLSLDSTGSASFTSSSLEVGTHNLSASFLGDATNAPGLSGSFSQTVQQLPTTITIASSTNPSFGGSAIHLLSKVTSAVPTAVTGAVTGVVTIRDGGVVLEAGPIGPDGTYAVDISSLSVATHSLTATYNGNTHFAPSGSNVLSQQVVLATTSVQLSSSAPEIIFGNNILLTAVVSGNGAVPTGTVRFLDGTVSLGSARINLSGQASLPLSNLTSGLHVLTAAYDGDAADNSSISSTINQSIRPATTALSLTSSSNPAVAGTPLTFIATLTSDGGLPSGSLVLRDGDAVLGTGIISATGSVLFTIADLSTQAHSLNAYFAGDTNHLSSTSAPLSQLVRLATSTVSVTSSQNPGLVGAALVLSAQVNGTGLQATGAISFFDGVTSLSTVPIINGSASYSATFVSAGSHVVTARYEGDATHASASPATVLQKIQQATVTSVSSSDSNALVGALVTFNAVVTGADTSLINGSISFYDGPSLLCTSSLNTSHAAVCATSDLSAGTHLVTAVYAGDQDDRGSTSPAISQNVNAADTSISLTASANPAIAGTPVIFSAVVASHGRAAGGLVTFLDGPSILGTAPVVSGVADLPVKALAAGQHAILARYEGDSGTRVSNSNVLLEVAQQQTTIKLGSELNPALTAQNISLTAVLSNGVNATGTISFYDGALAIGTAAVGADGATSIELPSLAAGVHSLSARYSGDSYNLPSTSGAFSETVQLRPTTASITASASGYLDGQQVTLVTVVHFVGPVSPSGTVTFTANGQVLGTSTVAAAAAATLTFEPTLSRYDIVAVYSGDGIYSGAKADSFSITKGSSTSFSLTSDPSSFSIPTGDHRALTLTLTTSASFSDEVSMGCLDLPAEATCTFSSNQMSLGAGGSKTLSVMFDTGNPLGAGTNRSSNSARSRTGAAVFEASFIFPLAMILGGCLVVARKGRRITSLLSLLLLVGTGFISGCGNKLDTTTTPRGVYTVRIIATGAKTSISQIAPIVVSVR